jgi:hypothetical protein
MSGQHVDRRLHDVPVGSGALDEERAAHPHVCRGNEEGQVADPHRDVLRVLTRVVEERQLFLAQLTLAVVGGRVRLVPGHHLVTALSGPAGIDISHGSSWRCVVVRWIHRA